MSANSQQVTGSVERVYAQALYDLSAGENRLEVVAGQMRELVELVRASEDLRRLLSSRVLSTQDRAAILDNVFRGRVDDLVHRFLQVVNQKGRLRLLEGIAVEFGRLMDEKHGQVEVDAYVASRMDDGQARRVAERIGRALDRQVVLHQYVDPRLIGGLKLRVGDQLIDGSVVTQLRLLRQRLVQTGREEARRGSAVEA